MLWHVFALAVSHLQIAHKIVTCATYVSSSSNIMRFKVSLWLKYGIKLFVVISCIQMSFLQMKSSP
jgi:hypothetical protein